jgi:hypothetical protein
MSTIKTNRTRSQFVSFVIVFVIVFGLTVSIHRSHSWPSIGVFRVSVPDDQLRPWPSLKEAHVSKNNPSPVKKSVYQLCILHLDENSIPTLPKTGPLFARSFEIHNAKPSPNMLCAFPST